MSKKINVMLALMLLMTQLVWAQNKTLTGKVTDNNGAPISGVSVMVKGRRSQYLAAVTSFL